MDLFLGQVFSGLANGAIYGCVALAVVMIYQAIDHFNFAQGEMATFSTFIAWQMIAWGLPFWLAFFFCLVISFIGGYAIERIIFSPIKNAAAISHVVVFIALFALFNSVAGFIWDFTVKAFPSPFPSGAPFDTNLVTWRQVGMMGVIGIMLVLIYSFFRFTSLGLSMRAAAAAPVAARLVGVRVEQMFALGWGLAATVGAVAGMMIAPLVFLEPNMMLGILLYGFAGAVVGGLNSPAGAVAGGVLMGLLENLAGTYIIGSELKLTFALAIIIITLMFRPAGLFGRRVVNRV